MTIELHPGQSEVFADLFVTRNIRNAVVAASRGWGKSYFAAVAASAACNELMQLEPSVPNKQVFIIAPTYTQVTDIYFPLLMYELGMENYVIKHSKEMGRLWFPFNVILSLVSYEAVGRLRGKGAYFVVNDEVRDWTKGDGLKEAWEGIIQPCISTRWSPKMAKIYNAKSPGRSLTISTPKGYDYFFDMYNRQELDNEWKAYHYDYHSSPYLDPDEIEKIRHTIDPLKYNREYKATFEDSGNSIFYCFKRKVHVRNDLEWFRQGSRDEPGEDVHVCIDFNVNLQCSAAFAVRGAQVHFIDEFKGHPDTETLAIAIRAKFWPNYERQGHDDYKLKVCKIFVYPDPTGRAHKTSAPVGQTDFTILERHGFIVRARSKSPPIVDSVNAVNARLMTAAGEVNLYVSSKCQGLITSLERTKWVDNNQDTATIDKTESIEHYSDGVRYGIEYLYPINKSSVAVKRTNRLI
jgi:hypothetical protein